MTAGQRIKPRSPTGSQFSEQDMAWAEDLAIALIGVGIGVVDAVELAAIECARRVADRAATAKAMAAVDQRAYERALAANRQEHHHEYERKQAAERAKYRAELDARAEQAKPDRPGTLKTSLGDLLRFKGR